MHCILNIMYEKTWKEIWILISLIICWANNSHCPRVAIIFTTIFLSVSKKKVLTTCFVCPALPKLQPKRNLKRNCLQLSFVSTSLAEANEACDDTFFLHRPQIIFAKSCPDFGQPSSNLNLVANKIFPCCTSLFLLSKESERKNGEKLSILKTWKIVSRVVK